jgi:hypothetical protein
MRTGGETPPVFACKKHTLSSFGEEDSCIANNQISITSLFAEYAEKVFIRL